MKEVFEKILDRLDDRAYANRHTFHRDDWNQGIEQARLIVQQAAEENESAEESQRDEELQYYHAIEARLHDMFGGEPPLEQYVDLLDYALQEPGKPHPTNSRILTYEDASAWEAYKQIGTVEECRTAMAYVRMSGYL